MYLHKDKSIFKLDQLPVDRFAESLGLPGAPRIKFLSREIAKQRKNAPKALKTAGGVGLEASHQHGSMDERSESEDDAEISSSSGERAEKPASHAQKPSTVCLHRS